MVARPREGGAIAIRRSPKIPSLFHVSVLSYRRTGELANFRSRANELRGQQLARGGGATSSRKSRTRSRGAIRSGGIRLRSVPRASRRAAVLSAFLSSPSRRRLDEEPREEALLLLKLEASDASVRKVRANVLHAVVSSSVRPYQEGKKEEKEKTEKKKERLRSSARRGRKRVDFLAGSTGFVDSRLADDENNARRFALTARAYARVHREFARGGPSPRIVDRRRILLRGEGKEGNSSEELPEAPFGKRRPGEGRRPVTGRPTERMVSESDRARDRFYRDIKRGAFHEKD